MLQVLRTILRHCLGEREKFRPNAQPDPLKTQAVCRKALRRAAEIYPVRQDVGKSDGEAALLRTTMQKVVIQAGTNRIRRAKRIRILKRSPAPKAKKLRIDAEGAVGKTPGMPRTVILILLKRATKRQGPNRRERTRKPLPGAGKRNTARGKQTSACRYVVLKMAVNRNVGTMPDGRDTGSTTPPYMRRSIWERTTVDC